MMEQHPHRVDSDNREQAAHQALLKRLDQYANVMDSRFRIPGTRLRFGLDGLIGLVPVVGDLASMGLSLYILMEAMRIGAPASVVRRMGANIGLDFLVGLVPVAGDALDFAFKANERNVALLRDYSRAQLEPPEPDRKRSPLVWVLAGMGALLLVLVLIAL